MERTVKWALGVLLVIVVIVVSVWLGRRGLPAAPVEQNPVTGRVVESVPQQPPPIVTPTENPYPGGDTPAPVPAQTAIPTQNCTYAGWTGSQIAEVLIERYEDGTPQRAIPPTTFVESAVITGSDGANFGLPARIIEFQSPTDMAIILSGVFVVMKPATILTPVPNKAYMLAIVDTCSGATRTIMHSDSLSELQDLLP